MPTPFEILKLTQSQNLAGIGLVSDLISKSYDAASQGVRVASGIQQEMMKSAIDFRRTEVDEWYKTEQLKMESQALDLRAQEASVDSWYKQNIIADRKTETAYQGLLRLEAIRNKKAYGVVTSQLTFEKTRQSGFKFQVESNQEMLGKYQKRLNDLISQSSMLADDVDSEKEIWKLQNVDIPETERRLKKAYRDFSEVDGRISALQMSATGLQYGVADPDNVIEGLKLHAPIQEAPVEEEESAPARETLVPSVSGETTGMVVDNKLIEKKKEAGMSYEQILERQRRMISNKVDIALVASQMPVVYNSRANPEAKRILEMNQKDASKSFAVALFAPIRVGETMAPLFQKNIESDKVRFLLNGGTEDGWNQIQNKVQDKFAEIKLISDPKLREKAIQDFLKTEFNPSPPPKNRSARTGNDIDPALAFDTSGKINIQPFYPDSMRMSRKEFLEKNKKETEFKSHSKTVDYVNSISSDPENPNEINNKAIEALKKIPPEYLGITTEWPEPQSQGNVSDQGYTGLFPGSAQIEKVEEQRKRKLQELLAIDENGDPIGGVFPKIDDIKNILYTFYKDHPEEIQKER